MDYCRILYEDWISGKSSTSNRRGIDTLIINSMHKAYRFQQTCKFNVKKSHSICLFLEQRSLAYTTRSVSRSTEVHCSLLSTSLSIIKVRLYQLNSPLSAISLINLRRASGFRYAKDLFCLVSSIIEWYLLLLDGFLYNFLHINFLSISTLTLSYAPVV